MRCFTTNDVQQCTCTQLRTVFAPNSAVWGQRCPRPVLSPNSAVPKQCCVVMHVHLWGFPQHSTSYQQTCKSHTDLRPRFHRPASLCTCHTCIALQMLTSMRQEASRQQAPAAPAYCPITLAVSQVLLAASQAAPASVLSRHEFVTLATDALLLCLPLTACLVPVSGNGFSSHNGDDVGVGQYEQVVPIGCSAQGVQQLQTGLGLVCQAACQLLSSCSQPLQAQLATSLMLAALPVMQTVSSGDGC